MSGGGKIILTAAAIVAVLASVALLTWLNRVRSTEGGLVTEVSSASTPVEVAVLRPREVIERLETSAVLRACRDVTLTSEVGAEVRSMDKDLGESCAEGEVLARLDREPFRIALRQARAAVEQAEAAHQSAQSDLARLRRLQGSDAVTPQRVEAAETGVRSAAAALEQARAGASAAARNLRETEITCPFDGRLARRMVEVGQLVGPQTPIARLVDVERLELTLSVGADEVSRLRIGQTVRLVEPRSGDGSHTGEVVRIGPAADERTRTFPVEVEIDERTGGEPEDLRPGQVVEAEVELAHHRGVLTVPTALLERGANGEQPSVLVARDGAARRVPLTLGDELGGELIVVSGLSAGAQLITVGGDDLEDGAAVEVVERFDPAEQAPTRAQRKPAATGSAGPARD
ncbi:MAG: efflux RND transporter periplasmic adaptor subunit [Polyangia bacterium]